MVLNTKELREVADKVLSAVDSSDIAALTDNLEIENVDSQLIMSISSKEYFVSVKLPLETNEDFHVTVNAHLFLNLISQITTEDVELSCSDKYLKIKGNGNYKLPLIYDGENLLRLSRVTINNVTCQMDIDTAILRSILKYNGKELTKGIAMNPVQKMYYIDEQGAITFNTGACINKFTLEKPVRLLLSNKVVKLFKLFNSETVAFTLGFDALPNGIIQTKICFENPSIRLAAIMPYDEVMLSSVPVSLIRSSAEEIYSYSATVNKNELIQAVNRLITLNSRGVKGNASIAAKFSFETSQLVIKDEREENSESVSYLSECPSLINPYEAYFDLMDIKLTLSTCEGNHIVINFGNSRALVIARNNIYNVIPEHTLYSS